MGKAVVYKGIEGEYDRIAIGATGGVVHIFAACMEDFSDHIDRVPLDMGSVVFVPGESYSRFGSDRKTSSGYVWWDGEPLTFQGTYTDSEGGVHALFTQASGPMGALEYRECYWSWNCIPESKLFVAITTACAGRVMEFVYTNRRKRK